jgi:hypothetical protein
LHVEQKSENQDFRSVFSFENVKNELAQIQPMKKTIEYQQREIDELKALVSKLII